VILFNNAGISSSSGEVSTTFEQMGANAVAFSRALGLNKVDVFGFSIGGMVAQKITLQAPDLVPKLRSRVLLIHMAESWLRLAHQAEKNLAIGRAALPRRAASATTTQQAPARAWARPGQNARQCRGSTGRLAPSCASVDHLQQRWWSLVAAYRTAGHPCASQ
jgi:pimeloyl-ACP methyl ester carboxylesterase